MIQETMGQKRMGQNHPSPVTGGPGHPQGSQIQGEQVQGPPDGPAMIQLDHVTKRFAGTGQGALVLDNVCAAFPAQTVVGLLGRNGAGKSTLLAMMAGSMRPTSGRVLTRGRVSYPVGFGGSFHPDLTGAQNTRFVARVYGADTEALMDFVAGFAALGPQFHQPFRTYSTGMRARLAFGVSMGLRFDTYLVDEVISVGDHAFREKSAQLFQARMKTTGAILVSHSMATIQALCDRVAVLDQGKLVLYDEVAEGIAQHQRNLAE